MLKINKNYLLEKIRIKYAFSHSNVERFEYLAEELNCSKRTIYNVVFASIYSRKLLNKMVNSLELDINKIFLMEE